MFIGDKNTIDIRIRRFEVSFPAKKTKRYIKKKFKSRTLYE
jgi:hypothetical protein